MKRSSRVRQVGISFFGLIVVMVVLAMVGILGAQVLPTAIEYQAIVKAVHKSQDASSPAAVRESFDRAAAIDDIKSLRGKDLEIVKVGDKNQVKFAYTKEIHMFGPAFLLLKYAGQSQQTR
jgi:hypothetical protein